MARWSLLVFISNAALLTDLLHHQFSSIALASWSTIPPVDAFVTPFAATSTQLAYASFSRAQILSNRRKIVHLNVDAGTIKSETESSDTKEEDKRNSKNIYTTAVLKVAYDGTYFRGWTAGNSEPNENDGHDRETTQSKSEQQSDNIESDASSGETKQRTQKQPQKKRQSRRSRTLQRKGGSYGKSGKIRTVADTIRSALAKLYGDVPPSQITIEACSRTDAGVHATSLVAQFYCSKSNEIMEDATKERPTQFMPTPPNSPDDTSNFRPLPFDSDLSKLVFVLNRMLPPDVRIVAASPLPTVPPSVPTRSISNNGTAQSAVFHPTLHTMGKTYTYKFAIGPIHDPLQTQYVWHLDGSSNRAVGMNGNRFCLDRALLAADLFVNSATKGSANKAIPRDYGAFRAAFRGTDRGRVQSTICTLWRCEILQETKELLMPSWESDASIRSDASYRERRRGSRLGESATGSNAESLVQNESPTTFTVVIMGDRFLYKMIRNIVGSLVAVGCGHLTLEDLRIALDTGKWGGKDGEEEEEGTSPSSQDSKEKPLTIRRICAPARGLSLMEVHYPDDVDFIWQTG
eukprot:CAMPEP_0183713122 /NCGR_PEP_ID=MMETSP0737-20130205/8077_1 /TAXON_ID=385413 /ORGANISM="Thalassiosira miniscula, Strain CCMP1093" /LENGTH=575 /DNA_ID=CAMNT_0025941871 /DNA_START=30 /DNA_END=1757 /DNA_ORIENTATION=+